MRFDPRAVPLRYKVTLPVAMILLAGVTILTSSTAYFLTNSLNSSSVRTALLASDIARQGLRNAMLGGHANSITEVVGAAGHAEGIHRIALRRADGSFVVRAGDTAYVSRALLSRHPGAGETTIDDLTFGDEPGLRATTGIANERVCRSCHASAPNPMAYLEVDITTTWFRQTLIRTHVFVLAVALLGFVLVLLAIIVSLHFAVMLPINRLSQVMKAVENGEMGVEYVPYGDDEIGRAGLRFNTLMKTISESEAELVYKQQLLAEAEKLAGVGLMAAGIAHEINNPLAAVEVAAEALCTRQLSPEQQHRLATLALEGSQRIQNIVAELLTLDSKQSLALHPEPPHAVLREALHSLEVPSRIRVRFRVSDRLPLITVDRKKMVRALSNLIKNAVQSMDGKGELTIEASLLDNLLQVSIMDTGCGIPQAIIHQVFDPFFSTRPTGKGFGLGLAIARGIILQHRGNVIVRSEEGKGTTFSVELPLSQEDGSNAKESLDPGTGNQRDPGA